MLDDDEDESAAVLSSVILFIDCTDILPAAVALPDNNALVLVFDCETAAAVPKISVPEELSL